MPTAGPVEDTDADSDTCDGDIDTHSNADSDTGDVDKYDTDALADVYDADVGNTDAGLLWIPAWPITSVTSYQFCLGAHAPRPTATTLTPAS